MIAQAVRARLVSLGVTTGGTTSGTAWVTVVGGLTDRINAPQIAIIDRAGLPPLTAHNETRPLRPGLQVLVRGLPDSYEATATKAAAVFEALHRQPFGTLMAIEAVSSPAWLGFTEADNRPTWSLNFIVFQE